MRYFSEKNVVCDTIFDRDFRCDAIAIPGHADQSALCAPIYRDKNRLTRIEPERAGCKALALTTTPPHPQRTSVKMPYLTKCHEKNVIEHNA